MILNRIWYVCCPSITSYPKHKRKGAYITLYSFFFISDLKVTVLIQLNSDWINLLNTGHKSTLSTSSSYFPLQSHNLLFGYISQNFSYKFKYWLECFNDKCITLYNSEFQFHVSFLHSMCFSRYLYNGITLKQPPFHTIEQFYYSLPLQQGEVFPHFYSSLCRHDYVTVVPDSVLTQVLNALQVEKTLENE